MNTVVANFSVRAPLLSAPPTLDARFLEPADLRWGRWAAADGASLRWAHLPLAKAAEQPRAHCVLLGGFTEFAEKYFETMRDLAARGLDVWFLDWREQGGSERREQRPGARLFDRDAQDLADFIATTLPAGDAPPVLVAHSMGAAIALLALHRNPALAQAAILSAPMLDLASGWCPRALARSLTWLATRTGFGGQFIPAGPASGPWRRDANLCPQNSITSHDPARCMVHQSWFESCPRLRVDGPTFAWADAAFALTARLRAKNFLAAITTPILIGSAGKEFLVRPQSHRPAAERLPHGRIVAFPDAKHELFHETDDVRSRWFKAIDHFLAEHLAQR